MSAPSPADIQYQFQHIQDDRSKQLLATYVVSLFVASVAVALRCVARRINRASLQADDYMIVLGWVGNSFLSSMYNLQTPVLTSTDLYCCLHRGNSFIVSPLLRLASCFANPIQASISEVESISSSLERPPSLLK